MQERSKRIAKIVLVVIATVHVALLVFGLVKPEAIVQFDRAAYRLAAGRALADAMDAGDVHTVISRYTPVGDYAWHGLALWVFRGSSGALILVQLALHGLSWLGIFRLVRELEFSEDVAWTAVCLYALLPIDLMVPHFVASEAFFNPLIVWGTFFLLQYAKHPRRTRDLIGSGLLFSAALMTRSEILPWLPLVVVLVAWSTWRQMGGWRSLGSVGVLMVCLLVLPGAWLVYRNATAGSLRFAEGELSIAAEISRRAEHVESIAHEPEEPRASRGPVRDYVHTGVAHPVAFAKVWALNAAKFLALPDNLDLFRYLGALEFTGKRAALVETQGLAGAFATLFRDMPLLMSVLVVEVLLFLVFWLLFLRGVGDVMRAPGATRILSVVLLSLPAVYVLLRAISQGESRKRSPVDFVLVIFVAVGWVAWRRSGWRVGWGTRAPS